MSNRLWWSLITLLQLASVHLSTVQLQLDSYTKTLDSVNFASNSFNHYIVAYVAFNEYEQIISTQIYSVNDLMHPRRIALLW